MVGKGAFKSALLIAMLLLGPGALAQSDQEKVQGAERAALAKLTHVQREKAAERADRFRATWGRWDLIQALHAVFGPSLETLAHFEFSGKIVFHQGGADLRVVVDPAGHYFRITDKNGLEGMQNAAPDTVLVAFDKDLQRLSTETTPLNEFQPRTHFDYADPNVPDARALLRQEIDRKSAGGLVHALLLEGDPRGRVSLLNKVRWGELTTSDREALILYGEYTRNPFEAVALAKIAGQGTDPAWKKVFTCFREHLPPLRELENLMMKTESQIDETLCHNGLAR